MNGWMWFVLNVLLSIKSSGYIGQLVNYVDLVPTLDAFEILGE